MKEKFKSEGGFAMLEPGELKSGSGIFSDKFGNKNHSGLSNLGLTIVVGVSVVAISCGVDAIVRRFRASGK